MIRINVDFGNGIVPIEASDDGTPLYPRDYWTPGIYETIAQAYVDGHWDPVPDPEPPPPDPDWTGFNLSLIPPEAGAQTTFEIWLSQFKPSYQTPLTAAAGAGDLAETQRIYNNLKSISSDPNNSLTPPTQAEILEWQSIAVNYKIGIVF